MILPQLPASNETTWFDNVVFSRVWVGNRVVVSMVKRGLVIPIVSTTNNNAIPATFLRGVFITGESCEILSRPEKARKEAAKPIKILAGPSEWFANIWGIRAMNSEKEICVKTVTRIARSLTKAIIAPTKLTFALSLMPIQFRKPRRISTPTVIHKAYAPTAGITTLRYSIPERQLMAAVRK